MDGIKVENFFDSYGILKLIASPEPDQEAVDSQKTFDTYEEGAGCRDRYMKQCFKDFSYTLLKLHKYLEGSVDKPYS